MAGAPESLHIRLENRKIYAIGIVCCGRQVDKRKRRAARRKSGFGWGVFEKAFGQDPAIDYFLFAIAYCLWFSVAQEILWLRLSKAKPRQVIRAIRGSFSFLATLSVFPVRLRSGQAPWRMEIRVHQRSAVLFPFKFALFLPGSQDFAGGGEIELAYHRIRPRSAELNWSQHVELLPVTAHTITINTHGTWSTSFAYLTVRTPKRFTRKGYTRINSFLIRDLHDNGSRNIDLPCSL
jgi:hypothetical protein